MGFLTRLFAPKEKSQSVITNTAELLRHLNSLPNKSGVSVNLSTAMTVAACYRAINLISGSIGSLPFTVFERIPEGGIEPARPVHPVQVLFNSPNEWQTRMEFVESMQAWLMLRGNAYALISRGSQDRLLELIPMSPDRVEVLVDDALRLFYKVRTKETGGTQTFPQEAVFHLKGLSSNFYTGRSVIGDAREVFGQAIAENCHSSSVFSNGASLGKILTHPGKLDKETADRIIDSWRRNYEGVDNAFKTALLEEGMKVESVSMNNEDAQLLESRSFSVHEISRVFGVPPHMLYAMQSQPRANMEQASQEFATYSLRTWVVRWEQAITKQLILNPARFFPRFNLNALVRADLKTRYESYAIGITNGFISPNEARNFEDLNARDGGDAFLRPLNMTDGSESQGNDQ